MSIAIKKIVIKRFRGIPDLELDLDGKSLLLKGENGTGKSSIVDAIEFFFTKKVSHLEGAQKLSLQRHGPHVNFTPDDVNIEIIFNPGTLSLSRTFASEPSPPESFKDYFQIARTGNFILRRSQILEFIICRPADRFKAIGNIIGVASLDDIELKMMKLRDELKSTAESKQGRIDQLFKDLSVILGENIFEFQSIHPILNRKLEEYGLPPMRSLEEDYEYIEEVYKKAKRKDDSSNKIKVLDEISDLVRSLSIRDEIIDKVEKLNMKIKDYLQNEKREKVDQSIVNMLATGRELIREKKMDTCPLCSQMIAREQVIAKIQERLEILHSLSEEASEVRQSFAQIRCELRELVNGLGILSSKIENFSEFSEENRKIKYLIGILDNFMNKFFALEEPGCEIPVLEIIQQRSEIDKLRPIISKKCNQLQENIGLTVEEKKILEVVRLIEQAKNKYNDIKEINSELKYIEMDYEVAERLYLAFSDTKKAKIQSVYDTIQEDIQRFYTSLHLDEPHKNIKLVVTLGRRASTELKMESFGRIGEDPRALTSEGHLDSLGLCIFLAFVKKFNEGCSLIILDDVVTTIDAGHRNRIAKLLMDEFGDNQLFITTHDEIWYDQLVSLQRAEGVQNKFKNIEILSWGVDTGPRIRQYKPRWEKILDKLSDNDKNGAGNESRIYLEWILKNICEAMKTPIIYKKSGKYTVAELFDSVEKRMKDLLKECDFKKEILEQFRKLRETLFMGNLLSHDNPLVEKLSINEVEMFCNTVHDLHVLFLCPGCRNFLHYFRSSRIVRCSDLKCNSPIKAETE